MNKLKKNGGTVILGAGITGLTAGFVTGAPVFEAKNIPGGICASSFVRPGSRDLRGPFYRFEICGGHWIFDADARVAGFLNRFADCKKHIRRASVYFSRKNLFIPYPIQNNLRFFARPEAEKIIKEIKEKSGEKPRTMKGWFIYNFGSTLCKKFFFPFNSLYTAGLYEKIAPQDIYKTPVCMSDILKGFKGVSNPAGYNTTFLYPPRGLNVLIDRLAKSCDIHFGKEVVRIDVAGKKIFFEDGTSAVYEKIISTLPLNKMTDMTGIRIDARRDPFSSALVLNIGATRGKKCPKEHWLYIPDGRSGFYRVGIYNNVNDSFLAGPTQWCGKRTSIYVEKAYIEGDRPTGKEISLYSSSVVRELQKWGFIGDVEVLDINWLDIAYTWSWPGSVWRDIAINALKKHDIHQAGRYGLWKFQGIAESIRNGLGCRTNLSA